MSAEELASEADLDAQLEAARTQILQVQSGCIRTMMQLMATHPTLVQAKQSVAQLTPKLAALTQELQLAGTCSAWHSVTNLLLLRVYVFRRACPSTLWHS